MPMATTTPAPGGTVDFGRSLAFVTEDPAWIKKILIGGGFTLLSGLLVGIPFVLGYFARTLRNVVEGAARPLPEWDDLGGIFGEGLRLAAVYLVYVVGGVIVASVPGCLLMAPAMLASGSRHGEAAGAALAGLGMMAFYGLTMLLSLAMLVYLPAALTRVALRGTVADGFDWRAATGFIRANLGNYLLSLVIFLVASVLSQLGILLCCVGIFPAAFWAYLVLAAGLGQTVRLSRATIG
jgi:hypothetical protein